MKCANIQLQHGMATNFKLFSTYKEQERLFFFRQTIKKNKVMNSVCNTHRIHFYSNILLEGVIFVFLITFWEHRMCQNIDIGIVDHKVLFDWIPLDALFVFIFPYLFHSMFSFEKENLEKLLLKVLKIILSTLVNRQNLCSESVIVSLVPLFRWNSILEKN